MGIPDYLVDNPKTEVGAMWRLTYRTMRWRKRKYPEQQWRIAGLDWITDKPKKGGKKMTDKKCPKCGSGTFQLVEYCVMELI